MHQRVLVADADPATLSAVEEALVGFNAEFLTAVNEDEAFKRFVEFGPDIVLADALLPRKGAFELLKRIRSTEAGLKTAIFVTSGFRAGTDLRDQAIKTFGALGVLAKPLNAELLRAEMGKILSQPGHKATQAHWLLWGKVEDEGGFDRASFPLVFAHAFLRQEPCRLAITNGKVRKVLHFADGKLTFAHSNLFSETLARYLLERGVVTEEGYKDAIQMTLDSGMKVGEAFVAMGQTDGPTVDTAVRRNILNKIFDLFTWNQGWYKIIPYAPPIAEIPGGAIPGESLLWTVVHEQMSPATIRDALLDAGEKTLAQGRPADPLPDEWIVGDLAPALRALQLSVSGRKIKNAMEGAAWEQPSTLYYLLLLGFLTPGEGPDTDIPADPKLRKRFLDVQARLAWMRGRNAFQILGVGVDDNDASVREAFTKLSTEFGPESEPPNASERLLRLIRTAYQLVKHAYEELATQETRRGYMSALEGDPGDSYPVALRAEKSFREGIEALRRHDWTSAHQSFASAAEINPVESEYFLYVGIARMNQKTPSVTAALNDAEEALWKAHTAAPHTAEPLYQLGKVALKKNELERAKDFFERALRASPGHDRSKEQLAKVVEKLSKAKGKKLGEMLRKPIF